MCSPKRIFLRFNSNVEYFRVTLYDNCKSCSAVIKNGACVCFETAEPRVRLIISPTSNEYNSKFYYNLNVYQCERVDLSFNFSKRSSINQVVNRFYLTDGNYGLPINGRLYFSVI